ncbi:Isopentenyl-diphosphate delta-isomerase type 1 [Trinorchestia longiramus]|nr:Isopentenyl-diphosphate delta-isomerase type 1 [Trinorchestia longiramus]
MSSSSLKDIPESQLSMLLDEQCILVDERDQITGLASKLDCHKWNTESQSSLLHRAFSVFLFNSQGELLVQQRSSQKVTFPGYFTNSCCSHPLHVEAEKHGVRGAVAAARRRLNFELGIPEEQVSPDDFQYLTRIHYSGRVEGSPFAEHEIDYIFVVQKDVELHPNPDEVACVQYVARDHFTDFLQELNKNNIPVTPWFDIISRHFLTRWWDTLPALHHVVDHQLIHHLR